MTRFELGRRPAEHVRLAVCDWLTTHGIDPNAVAISPGYIELRPEARQVAFLSYEFEDATLRSIRMTADRQDAVRIERVVQLESPPMPFPVGPGALL